jgi:hypothetical protein
MWKRSTIGCTESCYIIGNLTVEGTVVNMYTTTLKIQFYILPIECIYLYILCGCPKKKGIVSIRNINPLKVELNPIGHLLAFFGARHILHVSRIRVNKQFS